MAWRRHLCSLGPCHGIDCSVSRYRLPRVTVSIARRPTSIGARGSILCSVGPSTCPTILHYDLVFQIWKTRSIDWRIRKHRDPPRAFKGSRTHSRSPLHANHSPLCGVQALVDTALESSASAPSNAVPTGIWELRSGEWLAYRNMCAVEAARHGTS